MIINSLFEKIAAPTKIEKTLIYGGNKDENWTKYKVTSWKNIFENEEKNNWNLQINKNLI